VAVKKVIGCGKVAYVAGFSSCLDLESPVASGRKKSYLIGGRFQCKTANEDGMTLMDIFMGSSNI